MVRIKHRYLLVNILYPSNFSPNTALNASKSDTSTTNPPPTVYFHQPTPHDVSPQQLLAHIKNAIITTFGDWGGGKTAGVNIKYFSAATSTIIVRCPRATYRLVWAALSYLTTLPAPTAKRSGHSVSDGTRSCVFRVIRVSGTIRKASEEAIRRARKDIMRVKREQEEGQNLQVTGQTTVGTSLSLSAILLEENDASREGHDQGWKSDEGEDEDMEDADDEE